MSVTSWRDRITSDPAIHHGEPVIRGTRVSVSVIVGSIADWSRWTGMSFDRSGEVSIAGALMPVMISLERDCAVYVEPNVWVRHAL